MGKIIWNVVQSKIGDQLEPITNLAFADDTGVFGNSRESASFLVSETSNNLIELVSKLIMKNQLPY